MAVPKRKTSVSRKKMRRSHHKLSSVNIAEDKKSGGVSSGPKIFESTSCHHKPKVISGMMQKESSDLLKQFFKLRR